MDKLKNLPQVLLAWYDENRRDLPWRQDKEPYHVWLSEIMLQQTRVEAVKGYYTRFLQALPSIEALAQCEDDRLHKLWEGLGYYSRVRNLKKCAQTIMTDYAGRFPQSYPQILALPGIGEYTAGAICSICFDLPVPAVDGNVMRVISRITEDPTPMESPAFKKTVRQRLEAVYPVRAGDFTQALMELGATVCGPNRKPDCGNCPCREICGGRCHGTAEKYPVRLPRRDRKTEEMTVFILRCDGKIALQKRPDSGLLASLWQFPNCPGKLEPQQALDQVQVWGLHPRQLLRQTDRSHVFTHIRWDMRGIYMEVEVPGKEYIWRSPEEIEKEAALPTAFRQFWEDPV